jgi:integrase
MALTTIQVARLSEPGMYADGQGLYLQVTHTGAKSWIYRYQLNGRKRYLGLGSASAITLKRARELLAEPRRLRAEGIDPVDKKHERRDAARLAAATVVTFRECAQNYLAAHEHSWKSERHRTQWRASLQADAYPLLGNLPVAAIDTPIVLAVLRPIWMAKPESASRLRGRIETVLDAAKAEGLRTGENPARWSGHLENLLPAPKKVRRVEHHPALPYRDVPGFVRELGTRQGLAARALKFAILTATRTSEVLEARWSEIDFQAQAWAIPATRMKGGREHRVPLSAAALELLQALYATRSSDFVFPGKPGAPLSRSSMLSLLRLMHRTDITIHGFRSSFRDWAAEQTDFASEVVEMALAHAVRSAVEAAYRRGDLFEKRAQLMAAWAEYCTAE